MTALPPRATIAPPALVIFDCDGVLIDSEALSIRVESRCLIAHGYDMDEAEVAARYLGISGAAMIADLEARFGRPVPPALLADMTEQAHLLFESELAAMPGIHALLDRLSVPACVASSSRPERLAHTLGLTGLYERFAPNVFSSTMVARGKPAPDLFLHAARQMGAEPARSVVIEDSVAGVTAGVAAGMRVIGFCGGGHCPPDHGARLAEAGAASVYAHMDEIADALGAPR
jgi:HAD superfamily hydrolase (TIGR01509 family)